MTSSALSTGSARGGKILVYTRVLSAVIVPFLVLAFVVLYVFPDKTARWFAWPIKATMTSMTLASAYLGGVYFFTRVALRERRWVAVSSGLIAVTLFATLLGIATLTHWSIFSHDKLAFWLWTGLYLTTPFLVAGGWLANTRSAGPVEPDGVELSAWTARVVGLVGLLALPCASDADPTVAVAADAAHRSGDRRDLLSRLRWTLDLARPAVGQVEAAGRRLHRDDRCDHGRGCPRSRRVRHRPRIDLASRGRLRRGPCGGRLAAVGHAPACRPYVTLGSA
jgi:hypothetical protein